MAVGKRKYCLFDGAGADPSPEGGDGRRAEEQLPERALLVAVVGLD
jgi:hypothetical protein